MENNTIPRRIRMDLWVPAEKAIQDAVWEVEKIGADVRLTDAIILLADARRLVADFVDESLLNKEHEVQEPRRNEDATSTEADNQNNLK